ncbi:AraC family transcriptional regulator [Marinicauda salina]|nr:helix-turn-helix domain-containing protein [Marinicauda salina]
MAELEVFFRISAIALFAAQIALVLRDARVEPAARFYALMALGVIGFLATHASVDLALPAGLHAPLSFLSKTAALFIWWFVFALFVDGFRLGRAEIGFAAAWVALVPFGFEPVARLAPDIAGLASGGRTIMAAGLAVYILARLLADRAIDLVEPRRRARVWLAGAIMAIFLADLASDYILGFGAPPLAYSTAQKGAILIFAFAGMLIIAQGRPDVFRFESRPAATGPQAIDAALNARLQSALSDGVHLEPALSLPALARRLGAPEHRLRKLINEGLGHRNFRGFLNARRVETAKALLADPQRSSDSITAIAFDAGFASLASFNRVFKETVGETPSEWRRKNRP